MFNELVIQLLSCVRLFKTSWTVAAGLLWPLLSLGVCSKWHSLSLWCYLSLSSFAARLNLVNPSVQFSSATQSRPTLCDPMDSIMPGLLVHQQLLESTQTHDHWVGNSIQPSHPLFPFSCLQSFSASGSFQMSQVFYSGGQSIGVSALTSVFPMNIQDWFPLGWTGWISLQSKGLSRVFSNTTVQKHQFFSAQLCL